MKPNRRTRDLRRYEPKNEPYATRWRKLHVEQCKALLKRDLKRASRLADEKYKVFLESKGVVSR